MKNVSTRIAVAVVSVSLVLVAGLARAQDDEAVIKYRQAIMKSLGAHAGAVALIAKGEVPYEDQLVGQTHALAEVAKMAPLAFKQETMGGKTRAKDNVWSDWTGFEKHLQDLADTSAAVAAAAKSGEAVGPKLGALFDSCKGCHKDYRSKD